MGVLLNGRGIARDISKGGMCLVSPQIFKTMTTIQAKEFEGAPLRVMIPTEALTVNGIIAWVDLKKGKVPSASRAPRTTTSGSVCAASRRFSRVPSSSARTLHPPGGLLRGRRPCQLVTPFVFRYTRMSSNPAKGHLEGSQQVEKLCPQVGILGPVRPVPHPVLRTPLLGPAFLYGIRDILGIGEERHPSPSLMDLSPSMHALSSMRLLVVNR